MAGTLYVIGVGPGDPELLTLKAVKVLKKVQCLCVPKGREEGSSLALSIVKGALDLAGKQIIEAHFPMRKSAEARKRRSAQKTGGPGAPDHAACELDAKWDETVEAVLGILNRGTDMAFITIGDPTVYSTFFYLYDRIIESNPDIRIEIIPGISSITAAAARAHLSLSLADEKIAILPATYTDDLRDILSAFDTVVLMKVHKVLPKVVAVLEELGLVDKAVYVSRAGMEDEQVVHNLRELAGKELNYFSLVIVKK